MNRPGLFLAGAGVMFASVIADAAPFCVDVIGLQPSCIFYDAAECDTRASQLGGRCIANPSEFQHLSGPGRYCLIESSRAAMCIYADEASCATDAHKKHGACIDSVATGRGSDIFQSEPGRRY
jgi:hypothetical protein